jgi:hypothetical protein
MKRIPAQVEMLVVLNDLQLYRQCDEEALGAAIKFITAYKDRITHIVANGDITDYESQSRFSKSPDSYDRAHEEIEATRWFFKTLTDLCPKAEKVMVDGNHDARWENFIKDQTMGLEEWVATPDVMFRYKELGWKHVRYGSGQFYEWHNHIFWHGHRAGAKTNIPKAELEDAGVSGTSAHVNRNMYYEYRSALGKPMFWMTHGGFSKDNLSFMKKANTNWAQGFGVYYYTKDNGISPYMITMRHENPSFIFEGKMFDGRGFTIRAGVSKRGRGRPRKHQRVQFSPSPL